MVKLLGKAALLAATAVGLSACGGGGGTGASGGRINVSEGGIVVGSSGAPSSANSVTIEGVLIQSSVPNVIDLDVSGARNFSFFEASLNGTTYVDTSTGRTLTIAAPGGDSGFQFVRYMTIDDTNGDIFSLVGTRSGASVISAAPTGNLTYLGDGTVSGTYWLSGSPIDFSGGDATITVNLGTSSANVFMNDFTDGQGITSIEITNIVLGGSAGSTFQGGTIAVNGGPNLSASPVAYHTGGLYGAPNFGASTDDGPDLQGTTNAPPEVGGIFLGTNGTNTILGRYAGD